MFVTIITVLVLLVILFTLSGDSPPSNIRVEVLTPRSINVSWQPILSSQVVGYVVSYISTVQYARSGDVTISGAAVSHTVIEKLEENTLYNITVQSVTGTNNSVGDVSDVVTVLTWANGKSTYLACNLQGSIRVMYLKIA